MGAGAFVAFAGPERGATGSGTRAFTDTFVDKSFSPTFVAEIEGSRPTGAALRLAGGEAICSGVTARSRGGVELFVEDLVRSASSPATRFKSLAVSFESLAGGFESLAGGFESLAGGLESPAGGLESLAGGLEPLAAGFEVFAGRFEVFAEGFEVAVRVSDVLPLDFCLRAAIAHQLRTRVADSLAPGVSQTADEKRHRDGAATPTRTRRK